MASNATETTGSDAEQSEISETEVVENSPQVSEQVEALSTFTATHGSVDLKVLPNVERGGTDWRIVVYSRGVRGPILDINRPMTDQQKVELSVARQLQQRLNDALGYAQSELEL